jgi:hypothetical protein
MTCKPRATVATSIECAGKEAATDGGPEAHNATPDEGPSTDGHAGNRAGDALVPEAIAERKLTDSSFGAGTLRPRQVTFVDRQPVSVQPLSIVERLATPIADAVNVPGVIAYGTFAPEPLPAAWTEGLVADFPFGSFP